MLGRELSDEQGQYIVYQPFFDQTFDYQQFNLYECFDLLNENNYLLEYKQISLKEHDSESYFKLLSHVNSLTDAMYFYSIREEIVKSISHLLNDKIDVTKFKEEMVCFIKDVNIKIGTELTNFPITFSCYSIIKEVDVNPNFNGFSLIVEKFFSLCDSDVLDKTFKKEVKLLLREILQYN